MLTDKEFEDFVRKRFEEYEKEAPVHNWNHIQSALQSERRLRTRKRLWIATALLAILSPAAWFTYTQMHEQNQLVVAAVELSVSGTPAPQINPDSATHARHALPGSANPSQNEPVPPSTENATPETDFPAGNKLGESAPDIMNDGRTVQQPANLQARKNEAEPNSNVESSNNTINSKPASVLPSRKEEQAHIPAQQLALSEAFEMEEKYATGKETPAPENYAKNNKVLPETGMIGKNGRKLYSPVMSASGTEPEANHAPERIVYSPTHAFSLGSQLSVEEVNRKLDSIAAKQLRMILPAEAGKDSSRLYRRSLPYSIGVYVSPRYSFIRSIPNAADSILIDKIYTENKFSRERLGYEIGITVNRTFRRKWMLTGTVSFSHIKETLSFSHHSSKPDSITWTATAEGVMQLTPHFNLHHRQYQSAYQAAGLHLGASYYYSKADRRSLYVLGNVGVSRLISGRIRQYESGALTGGSAAQALQDMNYRFSFGLGYAQQLTRKMELTVEPTISYFLRSSFKSQAPVGVKPYTIGLNIGLRLKK